MAWHNETETDDAGVLRVYAWENEDKSKRKLVYLVDKNQKLIKFYPKGEFPVSEVIIEGFSNIPTEFSLKGYFKSGLEYYLNKKFSGFKIESITIAKDRPDSFRKLPKHNIYKVVISYDSFAKLKTSLTNISRDAQLERSAYVDEFFHDIYPFKYKTVKRISAKGQARRVLNNLDGSIIPELSALDIDKFLDFISKLLTKRYVAPSSRIKLLKAAKIKVDQIAINDVIKNYEELLKTNPPEAVWGKFLQQNLYLIESRYVAAIPELNLSLASPRKVDFGLVDSNGYLDIFEIKRSSTQLLSLSKDRGNYYWHTDTTKAIVQAEKYLFNANRKATSLKEDIRRERDINVSIIIPKSYLIIGSSAQLKNKAMREDFRILRNSLKNVEIILYDELLSRLKYQLKKIYYKPELSHNKIVKK